MNSLAIREDSPTVHYCVGVHRSERVVMIGRSYLVFVVHDRTCAHYLRSSSNNDSQGVDARSLACYNTTSMRTKADAPGCDQARARFQNFGPLSLPVSPPLH